MHDAKNTTLTNIAVGREWIKLDRVPHAGTNWIKAKLRVKVCTSYRLAASWDLAQYKHCIKRVVSVLIVFVSGKKVPL